jgi:hypothetical protein
MDNAAKLNNAGGVVSGPDSAILRWLFVCTGRAKVQTRIWLERILGERIIQRVAVPNHGTFPMDGPSLLPRAGAVSLGKEKPAGRPYSSELSKIDHIAKAERGIQG